MKENVHYGTVTEAMDAYRKLGFNLDFNIENNRLVCKETTLKAEDFEIMDIYRYEGDTDPADEAVVYAIKSKNGMKGVLVTGYGIYNDTASKEILEKLQDLKRK